jgi:exosortase
MTETQNTTVPEKATVLEKGFVEDLMSCWNRLPNKGLFFTLLAAWLLFFQFLGNATLGYVDTASLFGWMANGYRDDADGNGDGQGWIIPWVVVGLFWWKRKQLLALPSRTWWPALLMLAGALVLHALGYLIQQPRISIVALFGGIYALMGLAWGPAWLRGSLFPFFLFAFNVPFASIAQPITFRLRLLVSWLVTGICNNLLGIDVIREGTGLFNSAHTYSYEVAAACSGLRSTIAILALCTVYGFMTFDKNWKRILMMAAAFPLSMFGNTLRMLAIIVAAEIGGKSWGDFVHENFFFSLLPYVPAILGVIALAHWLREPAAEPALIPKPNPA